MADQRVGRGMFDDFRGYRVPDESAMRTALQTATVVVDANVLLNLYRYNESTRDSLLDVLRTVGDRLWVPHQVMREFWRNRLAVVAGRGSGADQLLEALLKQKRAAISAIEQWAKSAAVLARQRDGMIARVTEMYNDLEVTVGEHAPSAVGIFGGAMHEPVIKSLEDILNGRVGEPPTNEDWHVMVAEGRRRAESGQPPGYLDAAKSESSLTEGAAGDYLVWKQATDEVGRRGGDLLLVTGDEKEDWWWRHRSEFIGPRQELVAELAQASGAQLYMMRPTDLLRLAGALHVEVQAESVDDAERVGRESARQSWTAQGVAALLGRLEAENWEHAAVIRAAATNGGRIERSEIYAIGGYDDERVLRSFTRPTARITRDLQAEGLVAADVEPALIPLYERGPRASAFRIPVEMVALMPEADFGDDVDEAF